MRARLISLLSGWLLMAGLAAQAQVGGDAASSARGAARAAARWLELTPAQLARLQGLRSDVGASMAALGAEAARPGLSADASAQADICRRSREADQAYRSATRAVLAAQQLERLEALEQALALMPVIASAQGLGLVGPGESLAHTGLPESAAKGQYRWLAQSLPALPGCPATQVIPELGMEAAGGRKTPGP